MDTIYADKGGNAFFRCPHCLYEREFKAKTLQKAGGMLRIKCQCGQIVEMQIEFREFYRKSVNLYGQCSVLRNNATYPINVHNVSMNGIGFSIVWEAEIPARPVDPGDALMVRFRLDNASKDLIERRAVALYTDGSRIGASFLKGQFDKELGFYLLR